MKRENLKRPESLNPFIKDQKFDLANYQITSLNRETLDYQKILENNIQQYIEYDTNNINIYATQYLKLESVNSKNLKCYVNFMNKYFNHFKQYMSYKFSMLFFIDKNDTRLSIYEQLLYIMDKDTKNITYHFLANIHSTLLICYLKINVNQTDKLNMSNIKNIEDKKEIIQNQINIITNFFDNEMIGFIDQILHNKFQNKLATSYLIIEEGGFSDFKINVFDANKNQFKYFEVSNSQTDEHKEKITTNTLCTKLNEKQDYFIDETGNLGTTPPHECQCLIF